MPDLPGIVSLKYWESCHMPARAKLAEFSGVVWSSTLSCMDSPLTTPAAHDADVHCSILQAEDENQRPEFPTAPRVEVAELGCPAFVLPALGPSPPPAPPPHR